jgi:hypothetical protein
VGTLRAVAVALFGKWLQAKTFPPRLELTLRSAQGSLTERRWPSGLAAPERWYRLRVSNGRRWSPIRGVRIMLIRIDRRGATGEYRTASEGETPMRWEHQELNPTVRTVGPLACGPSATSRRAPTPSCWRRCTAPSTCPRAIRADENVILSFEARGEEGDSAILRVRIHRNEKWARTTRDGEELGGPDRRSDSRVTPCHRPRSVP